MNPCHRFSGLLFLTWGSGTVPQVLGTRWGTPHPTIKAARRLVSPVLAPVAHCSPPSGDGALTETSVSGCIRPEASARQKAQAWHSERAFPRASVFKEVSCPAAKLTALSRGNGNFGREHFNGCKFWQSKKSSISKQHPTTAMMGHQDIHDKPAWLGLRARGPGVAGCGGISQSLIRIHYPFP